MRHFNRMLLAQLPAGPPPVPPAGQNLVYGRTDGRLYTATSTATDLPVTPAYARLGTDVASASATVVNATGLQMTVQPGTYHVRYLLGYKTTATTTGIRVALFGPAVSSVFTVVEIWTEVAQPICQVLTTHDTLTTISGGSQGSTTDPLPLMITSRLTFTAAGVIYPRFSQLTTGTATLDASSVGYAMWVP